jgi:hypothetical protein
MNYRIVVNAAASLLRLLYTSVALGTLIGPSAAGFAFDLSYSYTLPILIGAGGNIIAACIMLGVSKSAAVAAE